MKKITLFIFSGLLLFLLISCDKESIVNIINQEFSGNTYSFILNANGEYSDDDILELAYTSSSQIYESISSNIGNNKVILSITFQINNNDKLNLKFSINNTVNSPGLTLLEEIFVN